MLPVNVTVTVQTTSNGERPAVSATVTRVPVWCCACSEVIDSTQPVVLADSTGREGAADDPYHLHCFLAAADLELPENHCLARFARDVVTRYLNGLLG